MRRTAAAERKLGKVNYRVGRRIREDWNSKTDGFGVGTTFFFYYLRDIDAANDLIISGQMRRGKIIKWTEK
jgi:hypothetical protein